MKNAKIVKKLFAALLAICCVMSTIKPASATVQPMIDSSNNASAILKIASNTASCSVYATAKSVKYEITAKMTLYCVDKSPFTPLKTWSVTGIYSISATENWYVSHGHDYQVIADITVKDSNNKTIESFTANSPVVHY